MIGPDPPDGSSEVGSGGARAVVTTLASLALGQRSSSWVAGAASVGRGAASSLAGSATRRPVPGGSVAASAASRRGGLVGCGGGAVDGAASRRSTFAAGPSAALAWLRACGLRALAAPRAWRGRRGRSVAGRAPPGRLAGGLASAWRLARSPAVVRVGRRRPAVGVGGVAVAAPLGRRSSASVVGLVRRSRSTAGGRRSGRSRWATASNRRIDPATAALSDPTAPRIGMRMNRSQRRRTAGPRPWPSLPTTIASGPRRSRLAGGQRRVAVGAGDAQAAGVQVAQRARQVVDRGTAAGARPRRPRP